jgi:hypothetical protein
VGFFDDLKLPGGRDEEDDYSSPEWWAAPEDWVAGVVAAELVLARNDEAAVYVTRLAAYPQGFEFDAVLVTRKPMRGRESAFDLMYDPDRPEDEIPPELVRLGVAFSDGRRASSFGEMVGGTSTALMAGGDDENPPDPERDIVMTAGGGSGGMRHSTQSYWVWPLPPSGPLTFACEWPAFDIAETTVELDAETVREASRRARSVWD